MKLALMASGSLGYKSLELLASKYILVCVFTDMASESIIEYTKVRSIECFVGNPRNATSTSFIDGKTIDVLLSINYLFIIEEDLIKWPEIAAVNLHGSLLPKYRGRAPHVWAIINNEKVTGVTAHLITLGCDEGDVLRQEIVAIEQDDTGSDILKKYEELYPKLILEVLDDIQKGNLVSHKQDEIKATYFGKRTPSDGEINWNWQKVQIRNWVRAQSYPYPGAFTWLGGQKIIIDEVLEDDYGFHQSMDNGLILTRQPLRVKTPNGVLKIVKLRDSSLLIKEGMKFRFNENR